MGSPKAVGARFCSSSWGCRLAALLIAAAGCRGAPPEYALRVGHTGYTDRELGALGSQQLELLADLTAFGLAVSQQRLGEVARPFVEHERQALLLQKLATEVALRQSGTDEARLRELYGETPEYELVVRHLVRLSERWRPQAHRDSARAAAQAALERVRSGEDFAAVAAEVSEEPGAAERGGLLQPGRKSDWVSEFWSAASALEPGEVSNVVETEYGFHVLKLEERRPVPFEEVRSSVLTRLVDLDESLEQARRWASEQAAELELHQEAVARWRAGGPDALSLATWPGQGSYTGQQFGRYLLTLTDEERARLREADAPGYVRVVASVARNALLADRAAAAGIELSATERAAGQRRWRTQVEGWANTLGFEAGQSAAAVRARAVEALGAERQSVQIVRSRIDDMGAALRDLYEVHMPPASSQASGARP